MLKFLLFLHIAIPDGIAELFYYSSRLQSEMELLYYSSMLQLEMEWQSYY